MGVKKKKGKDRLDKFYHLAKEHGYRSRAAFKLIQLNKKFDFLSKANVVLDLCAAPGSWCQVAAKFMPASKTIIGVDLDPIKPIPNVITFVNDITTQSCRQEIKKQIKNNKAEVVLHDGAPNVGTQWTHDAYMQAELTLSACRLATEFLAPNGTFVTKVFRSAEYTKLLWVFHQLFSRVSATKPQASRNVSAEIFVVCEGYLAPKKIDPKLLDPKYVLTTIEQNQYAYSVFAKKQSRHRTGYEEGVHILHKKIPVTEFIQSDDPVKVLSSCNELHFEDENCKRYLENPKTTEEIKICMSDLKVLGKRDFKSLLKWRAKMKAMDAAEASSESSEEEDAAPLTKEQEDAAMLKEMDDHLREAARAAKRKAKKLKEIREKQKKRMALSLDVGDEFDDPGVDGDSLFNLKKMNHKLATDVNPDYVVEKSSESEEEEEEEDLTLLSDDEIKRRYEAQLEQTMDDMYTSYLMQTRKNKKRVLDRLQQEGIDDMENEAEGGIMDLGSDDDLPEVDAASKLIIKDAESVGSVKAKMWFEQDLFKRALDDTVDEQAEMQRRLAEVLEAKKKKKQEESGSESSDEDGYADDESEEDEKPAPKKNTKAAKKKQVVESEDEDLPLSKKKKTKDVKNSGVHIVDVNKRNLEKEQEEAKEKTMKAKKAAEPKKPVPKDRKAMEKEKKLKNKQAGINPDDMDLDGSSSDSAESSFEEVENNAVLQMKEEDTDYDTDEKAEIMAMAARLRDPTQRSDIISHSYSKHAFSDGDNLPSWFVEDEKANNKPLIPITRDEFQAYKQQLKAIDSRATHRVAEAQARKKKRVARAMEKAKQKAGKVIEADDIPDSAKRRELERIFAGAKSKYKPSKTYVVGGDKGRIGHGKGGKGSISYTRFVDSRLKADKRAAKARERRKRKRS